MLGRTVLCLLLFPYVYRSLTCASSASGNEPSGSGRPPTKASHTGVVAGLSATPRMAAASAASMRSPEPSINFRTSVGMQRDFRRHHRELARQRVHGEH